MPWESLATKWTSPASSRAQTSVCGRRPKSPVTLIAVTWVVAPSATRRATSSRSAASQGMNSGWARIGRQPATASSWTRWMASVGACRRSRIRSAGSASRRAGGCRRPRAASRPRRAARSRRGSRRRGRRGSRRPPRSASSSARARELLAVGVPPLAAALVRGRDHGLAAVRGGQAAHGDRLRRGSGAVVDARQDVAVQVDHQAAEPALPASGSLSSAP